MLTAISGSAAHNKPPEAQFYWTHEAIKYLRLDQSGLEKPDRAFRRLVHQAIASGRLQRRSLAGKPVFTQADLDHLYLTVQAQAATVKRGRGRPRKRDLLSAAVHQ